MANRTVVTEDILSVYLDPTRNYYLKDYWNERCDPRTAPLWLMADGPWKLLAFTIVYSLIVVVGPWLMRARKPYELRISMLIYNTAMVITNGYFLVHSLNWLRFDVKLWDFRFPSLDDRSPESMTKVHVFHLYLWSKFVDYFDTVVFVLRKKQRQLTFLHIYHHSMVPIFGWVSIWMNATIPSLSLFMMLNCTCHVMMYSYYALAALGPWIQPYLWWKRYITQAQMIQFVIIGIYATLLNQFHINYPAPFRMLFISQAVIFFIMFGHFYIDEYTRKCSNNRLSQHSTSMPCKISSITTARKKSNKLSKKHYRRKNKSK